VEYLDAGGAILEISVDLAGLDVPAVGGLARLRAKRPNQTALTSSRITLNIPGSGIIEYVAAQQDSEYGVIYWHIITTEMSSHTAARATFAEAGVSDLITILEGDARTTLKTISEPVQFVLLDGWPDLDLTVVKILEPVLAPGALIVGDNVNLDPNHAYLNYAHAPKNGYVSTPLPLDKGLELAVRV